MASVVSLVRSLALCPDGSRVASLGFAAAAAVGAALAPLRSGPWSSLPSVPASPRVCPSEEAWLWIRLLRLPADPACALLLRSGLRCLRSSATLVPLRTPRRELPSIRRRALPPPRSCCRALVCAAAPSSPRCVWSAPTRWSPTVRVSTPGAWSAIGRSSVPVPGSEAGRRSMPTRLSVPGPFSRAPCRSHPACISVPALTCRGRRRCGPIIPRPDRATPRPRLVPTLRSVSPRLLLLVRPLQPRARRPRPSLGRVRIRTGLVESIHAR